MAPTPTVAVGLGRAGCAMLAVAERRARGGTFECIAVDSSRDDLRTFAPRSATHVPLGVDYRRLERAATTADYLRNSPEVVPEAGANRNRPVGRFLLDSGSDAGRLFVELRETVATVAEEAGGDRPVHLWVLSSLGGGTGSGILPLVVALLATVRDELDVDAAIYGAGALPRLDELDRRIGAPGGEPVHYANAYAALAELRTLLDIDGSTDYPVRLGLHSEHDGLRTGAVPVAANPIAAYWLVGVDESDHLRRGFEQVDRTVADLIHYLAAIPADETGPFDSLCSVTGVTVSAPMDRYTALCELERELRSLDEELGSIRAERERLQRAQSHLTETLQLEAPFLGSTETTPSAAHDVELTDVDPAVVTACRDRARWFESVVDAVGRWRDRHDRVIDELHEAVAEHLPPDVDGRRVVRYVFVTALHERVRADLADHQLPELVEILEGKWLDAERRPDDAETATDGPVDDAEWPGSPVARWREGIRPRLQELASRFRTRSEQSLLPAMFTEPGKISRELEGDIARGDTLASRHERLDELVGSLEDEREAARADLRAHRDAIEDLAEASRDEWIAVHDRWATRRQRADRLAEKLTTVHWHDGELSVPLDLESDRGGVGADTDGGDVSSLVSTGLVRREGVVSALETALDALEEPVEDLSDVGPRDDRLGVIATEDDHELLASVFGDGGNAASPMPDASRRRFDELGHRASGARTGSFSLLGLFSSIRLERMSEFQTIHAYFHDEDDDISSLLGSVSDAELESRVAYPELWRDGP